MNRIGIGLAFSAIVLGLAGCSLGDGKPIQRIVVVCIDTVRFDTFFLPEEAGIKDELSPYLSQAVVYSRAHAPAPWTVPSVISLFTGKYPAQHGAGQFTELVADLNVHIPSRLPDGEATFPKRFQEAGFTTGAFVAHPWFQSGYGMESGFDELHLRKTSEKLVKTGLEWMDKVSESPFLLYLHFMEAHDRHLHRDRFEEYLEGADANLLAAARKSAPREICTDESALMCRRYQVYADAVARERAALAGLLSALSERGLMEKTAVLVYSDHGEEFHDHVEAAEELAVDPRDIHGFGHGQSLFQEQLHVPLLVWHPGFPGQHMDSVVSLIDVAPTLLSWAGIDHDVSVFSGKAMSASRIAWAGPFDWSNYEPGEWPRQGRRIFASGIAYGPEQMAVLDDGWKYIWHEASGDTELYDLRNDPEEQNPVDSPDVAAALEPALDRYFSWYNDQAAGAPELTDEQVQQLKGVGYLQGRETGADRNASEKTESSGDSDG